MLDIARISYLSVAALVILAATGPSSSAFQPTAYLRPRIRTTKSRYIPFSTRPQTVQHYTIERNGIVSLHDVINEPLPLSVPLHENIFSSAPVAAPVYSEPSLIHSPSEAFQILADKGKANAKMSNIKTLVSAMLGGAYVGMGGMVSLAISGNMMGIGATNPGLPRLVFALLFPVNLLLVLQCGGQLFTGNTATMAAAVCEKKATLKDLARSWGLSYIGNLLSCSFFAVLCRYCGVLSGGAAELAAQTLVSKTSSAFGPCLVKAILCNWLVCLAIYLSTQAKDMTGKYIGILLPISTFVAIGFEHSVANFFLLTAGMLSGSAMVGGISLKTIVLTNLIPVTIGNVISGSLLVGVMFSFMYGRLGKDI